MKQIFSLLILVIAFFYSDAQDIKKYIQQNTVAINTVQPDSVDFADLEAIGNAIGDARIVMLGEQDHGDAPAYLAKTRLIKYLHEKKGFTVLAFESDFFGLTYGWSNLPKNQSDVVIFSQGNIFPVWSLCDACQDLFKRYIPKTQFSASPMQLAGFDNQLVLNYSSRYLSKKLDSVLQSHNLPITKEPNYATEIFPLIDSCKRSTLKDTTQYSRQLNYLLAIKAQLGKVLPADDFWMVVLDNLVSENSRSRNANRPQVVFNERDKQMAQNLLWLSNVKYPTDKIIVWAQNAHISKDAGHYDNSYIDVYNYMGSVFDAIKSPALKTYTLGFASYKGTAGRITAAKTETVKDPKKNGFENWINESYNFAFTDLSKFNRENPGDRSEFFMKGHDHFNSLKTAWHHKFDGIFFIREMYRCRSVF
ncbi:MAG: erythromycin esterase family protein [Chitinophagaceae bacterium]|nr:erythromycin esterase family protein [Chitinophagaceae bacterium]